MPSKCHHSIGTKKVMKYFQAALFQVWSPDHDPVVLGLDAPMGHLHHQSWAAIRQTCEIQLFNSRDFHRASRLVLTRRWKTRSIRGRETELFLKLFSSLKDNFVILWRGWAEIFGWVYGMSDTGGSQNKWPKQTFLTLSIQPWPHGQIVSLFRPLAHCIDSPMGPTWCFFRPAKKALLNGLFRLMYLKDCTRDVPELRFFYSMKLRVGMPWGKGCLKWKRLWVQNL